MPNHSCPVCQHSQHDEIDKLIGQRVGYKRIARQFKPLTAMALAAHKSHIAGRVVSRVLKRRTRKGDQSASIVDQLTTIGERLSALATAAAEMGNVSAAVQALREIRATLESLEKILPEKDVRITVVYQDSLTLPTLRQITPAIVLREEHPLIWQYLLCHVRSQLPDHVSELENQLARQPADLIDGLRREIRESLDRSRFEIVGPETSTSGPD